MLSFCVCQVLPVRKSFNDPFEIYSWTMKMVCPACWLWPWLLAMQCPRTLTKCMCLSFDKTSICWAKLCGKFFCFSLIHLTVTAMPSLRLPLYNCWNTKIYQPVRLYIMLCFLVVYLLAEKTCCIKVVSRFFHFLQGENVVRWQTNHCRSHCLRYSSYVRENSFSCSAREKINESIK